MRTHHAWKRRPEAIRCRRRYSFATAVTLRPYQAQTGLNLLGGGRMINPWRWSPRVMKQIQRRKAKGRVAKLVLRLPDLEVAKSAVLNSLSCPDAQRGYRHAIDEFVDWYCTEPRLSFSKTVVVRYRTFPETN